MECSCRVALSGFGRDQVLFDLIRGFQVEFLKIDGSIIDGIEILIGSDHWTNLLAKNLVRIQGNFKADLNKYL